LPSERPGGTPPAPTAIFYGWVIVGAAGVISFAEVAFFNPTLGVFLRPLAQNFGWSRAAVSLSISLGTLAAAVMGPLLGPYLDRHGPRRPLLLAVLAAAGCAFALAAVHSLWQFDLLFGMGRALTVGVIDVCLTVTVARWFIAGRGRAVSITVLSQRLGFATLPLIAQVFVLHGDWRQAWLAIGLLVLVLALAPALIVEGTPEDRGLRPDGMPAAPVPQQATTPAKPATRPIPGIATVDLTLHQAVRTGAFWLITLATAQSLLAQGAVNLHQLPHLEDRGIPPAIAALAVSVFAIAGACGALLSSWPRRRLGSRRAFGLYLFTSTAGLLILIGVHHIWQAFAFAVIYGLSFGGQLTMLTVVYADLFGRTHLGSIRGVAIPVQLAANAIGPVFAGWVYDRSGSYVIAFSVFAVLYASAGVYSLVARDPTPGLRTQDSGLSNP
jgi:OFA family oxalate/formate antiporter-like MFS transporter